MKTVLSNHPTLEANIQNIRSFLWREWNSIQCVEFTMIDDVSVLAKVFKQPQMAITYGSDKLVLNKPEFFDLTIDDAIEFLLQHIQQQYE